MTDISEALRPAGGFTEMDIMVTPNAKTDAVGTIDPWRKRVIVKVQNLPQEGRANAAVTALFRRFFNADVEIIRGHTDRHKTVLVHLGMEDVLKCFSHEESK